MSPRNTAGKFVSADCAACGNGVFRYEGDGIYRCDGLATPERDDQPLYACPNWFEGATP